MQETSEASLGQSARSTVLTSDLKPPSSLPVPSVTRGLTRADLMTATQVADLLDVPVSTVLEWGRNGTLPRVKLGRHVRFLRTQVEQVILAASPRVRAD